MTGRNHPVRVTQPHLSQSLLDPYKCVHQVLTVRHRVYPVLVETGRDAVHLCVAGRLLQLSPLLSESVLHHGRLREGAIWILKRTKMREIVGMMTEKQTANT